MRVYIESNMTVCHGFHVVALKAGQVVDGPLAQYLAESGCDVTIEHDDRTQAVAEPPTSGTGGPGDGVQAPVEIPLTADVTQDSNIGLDTGNDTKPGHEPELAASDVA